MTTTSQPLRILHVEDSADDVDLALRELRRSGYDAKATRVESADAMREALQTGSWDLVLSDCSMPRFSAVDALGLLHDVALEVPFIIVSGTIAEETAAAAMRAGAHDFIRKDKLSRLSAAVDRELLGHEQRRAQKRAEGAIRASEARYRALFNACPSPLWAYDPVTLVVQAVNDAAAAEHGYEPQEIAEMTLADAISIDAPPTSNLIERFSATPRTRLLVQKRDGGVSEHPVRTRVIAIDGHRVAISVSAAPQAADRGETPRHDVLELAARAARSSVGPAQPPREAKDLEARFDDALDRLWIAFQPIVSWRQRTVFGYEAFVRSEEAALSGPVDLLGAAESLGRLNELGRLIRMHVARLASAAPPTCKVFVNVHSAELGGGDLFSPWAPLTAIARSVVLELSADPSTEWAKGTSERLQRLRRLGYQIAVDGSGAGFSGLTSLSHAEPEIAKLDMSLVRGVDTSSRKRSVIRSMLELAGRDLGMLVVCEGVETAAERDTLASLGADLMQGHLFARPARGFAAPTF
jgi:EAL domain-containing protein (putative c-di-GMP-specific phosphodiesterase class I)/FixJ family two-component response regulator